MYVLHIFFFFFNDTATTEIYTLSLHDALPISPLPRGDPTWHRRGSDKHAPHTGTLRPRTRPEACGALRGSAATAPGLPRDRKSTRLNSSHLVISYAVFCLKKKKRTTTNTRILP